MDQNHIYSKTPAGEDAIRLRTRFRLRDLRMVLILVDGRASVGELAAKVGDALRLEQSLQELEREGFIALVKGADPIVPSCVTTDDLPGGAASGREGESQPEEALLKPHEIPSFQEADNATEREFCEPDDEESHLVPLPPPVIQKKNNKSNKSPLLPAFFRCLDKGSSWRSRTGGKRTKVVACILLIFTVMLGGYLAFPKQRYRQIIAETWGHALGRPVKIGALHFGWAGQPALVAHTVEVGGTDVELGRIALIPHWMSLLSTRPLWERVEVEGARLPLPSIVALRIIDDELSAREVKTRVIIKDARLTLGTLELPGRWQIDSRGGEAGSVTVASTDASLQATVVSVPGGIAVSLHGMGWHPQADSRWKFDQLEGKAIVVGSLAEDLSVAVSKLDLVALDGRWQGEGQLRFHGGKVALDGRLSMRHVAGARLAELAKSSLRLQAPCSADLVLRAQGSDWDSLETGLAYEGSFSAGKGEAAPGDLLQAVRAGVGVFSRGGATTFDDLAGRIRHEPRITQFTAVTLQSGLVGASGHLSVEAAGKLDGIFDVQLRGSANRLRTQVQMTGTVTDPQLRRLR